MSAHAFTPAEYFDNLGREPQHYTDGQLLAGIHEAHAELRRETRTARHFAASLHHYPGSRAADCEDYARWAGTAARRAVRWGRIVTGILAELRARRTVPDWLLPLDTRPATAHAVLP